MNYDKKFIEAVQSIVYSVLQNENLLTGEWHNGKVASVIDSKTLTCYIDGSTTAVKVPCNPNITFAVNDEVFVIYCNRNSNNKYVIAKRAI
jgi:hypothetical protein